MRMYGRCTEDDENETKLINFTYTVMLTHCIFGLAYHYCIYFVQASDTAVVAKVMV
jgi:hypothetical protein